MRTRVATVTTVLILVLCAAPAAQAASSYCSPTGDYCTGVLERQKNRIALRISTFSFRGTYRLCVRPPRGRGMCRRFRLLRSRRGIYQSTKGWKRHFPARGEGIYRVRWVKNGAGLGPRLSFRR